LSTPLFTPAAKRDIRTIWRYIARDSVRHADLVREAIFETCALAAEQPVVGHKRAELSRRSILFRSVRDYEAYLIAYVEGSEPLRILRVLHGARNFQKHFRR
jgi:plasmid stabilization system protein ParE